MSEVVKWLGANARTTKTENARLAGGHMVNGVTRTYEHAGPAVLVAELNKLPRCEAK